MTKVLLGGTFNNSTWREKLIPTLEIDYFNPVFDEWTPDCINEELRQREICDFCLYCITPKMTGVYSIAEVVDDSNKKPKKTILCILNSYDEGEFSEWQLKSLRAVAMMVKKNGGTVFYKLSDVSDYLNQKGETK